MAAHLFDKLKQVTYIHGIIYFSENSYFTRYLIAYERNHWVPFHFGKRLFWLIFFLIAIYGATFLLQFVAETFHQERIAVNLETYNLHWIHTFPAVSICMMKRYDWDMDPKFVTYIDSYLMERGMDLPYEWVLEWLCLWRVPKFYLSKF